MDVKRLQIPDLLLLSSQRHGDERGFFSEVFRVDVFERLGVTAPFVQDNHVRSAQRGVLRGLHYQTPPHAQGKLVRCARGAILDVAVDIRRGSSTFGQHVAVELSEADWRQIWVPPGFAHGYITLSPECEVIYKVTAYYEPASERGIAWDDPALGIDWGMTAAQIVLSAKDQNNPTLAEVDVPFE